MAEDVTADTDLRHLDRRRVLLGAGAVGLAGVLAACGTDGAETAPPVEDSDADDGDTEEGADEDTGADDDVDDDDVDDDDEDDADDGDADDGDVDGDADADGIVATSDVPVGEGVIVSGENVVVTQPSDGEFRAFSSTCTHQGCTVSSVQDGTINCACHGSRFSIDDGSVANGPATQPLPDVPISVVGDQIVRA